MKAFLLAVGYQTSLTMFNKSGSGLMRVNLNVSAVNCVMDERSLLL